MDLLSNTPYDVRSHYGNLILVYLGSDEEKCKALKTELEKAGYSYMPFPISADTLLRHDYLSGVTKALDSCACLIPVISDDLFDDSARIYSNIFWLVIGYMQAKCYSGGIVPYLAEDQECQGLASTPLQNANLARTGADVVRALENRYSNRLMKSHYYDNYELNDYAQKRIIYRRITFKCRIYEDAFQRTCKIMEYDHGDRAEADLERLLVRNIGCSYKVLSFGCENALVPQLEPYREEIHPSESGLTSSIKCSSSYAVTDEVERIQTGVHAEVEVEAVIPVHKLFGVYFKCYIEFKKKDYFWIIPMLFSRDLGKCDINALTDDDLDNLIENPEYGNTLFPENAYIDSQKGRLYFSLGLDKYVNSDKSIVLTPEMGVGSVADFIFPQ